MTSWFMRGTDLRSELTVKGSAERQKEEARGSVWVRRRSAHEPAASTVIFIMVIIIINVIAVVSDDKLNRVVRSQPPQTDLQEKRAGTLSCRNMMSRNLNP
ncbi:unnamed protein product [Arctogadus glacialis]